MEQAEVKEKLNIMREELGPLKRRSPYAMSFYSWQRRSRKLLVDVWGEGADIVIRFDDVPIKMEREGAVQDQNLTLDYENAIDTFINILSEAFVQALYSTLPNLPAIIQPAENPIHKIAFICDNFHNFANQLKTRRAGKDPVLVDDEYDVQYLLNALLRLFFDKVRAEDWTPQYAGKSSRMDFVIEISKQEKIIIEAKKTRSSLGEKEVGSQLIDDIFRYKARSDCKTLICFVYDPDEYIRSPRILESDLNGIHEGLNVLVFIRP